MIIISNLLNTFYKNKLKNKVYRNKMFVAASKNELRNTKVGKIILRNLNELMNEDTAIHNEFILVVGENDFQTKFWASDLGYLWFEGNANSNKPYFNEVVSIIKQNNINTLLDVGCGWGIFCDKCIKETNLSKVIGIDISLSVIENAKARFNNPRLNFEVKDLFSVNEHYDLVTIFGSIDYVTPDKIEEFLLKMLNVSQKNVVIVNSLRKISLEDSLALINSMEVKRYDIGYVHPLNNLLLKNQAQFNYTFTIVKSGIDSSLTIISK